MPRGRQYYDPIVQAPSRVAAGDASRVELYPEHDVRDNVEALRWCARLIGEDGLIKEVSPGSIDHDDALRQAQELWPGLEVFELREESEDSTWEGVGPSPRLWQDESAENIPDPDTSGHPPALELVSSPEPPKLHALSVGQPGVYLLLDDILSLLESYATQYDQENNPSAALGLREAANALQETFST